MLVSDPKQLESDSKNQWIWFLLRPGAQNEESRPLGDVEIDDSTPKFSFQA